MTRRFLMPLVAASVFTLPACGEAAEPMPADTAMATETAAPATTAAAAGTVVDVASGNADFSTLVAAVTAAKLGDTLKGPGPFTVFAPTNAAFSALPAGTVETLTTTQTDKLGQILTYHVVAGEIMSPTLVKAIEDAGAAGYSITTVNGAKLTAKMADGKVTLTDAAGNVATVAATDVDASNGVIHVIDKVLMPS